MKMTTLSSSLLVPVVVFLCGFSKLINSEKHVVCFVTSWAVKRSPPYKFTIKDIDPSLCTHLVYAFALIKNDTVDDLVAYDSESDLKVDGKGLGQYTEITELKKKHPHLKVSLCMGGNSDASSSYSALAQSTRLRSNFARNAASYLRRYGFDGLDIFWKFPTQRGGREEDKQNFPKLLQEIKREFDRRNLFLTVTLTGVLSLARPAYELSQISHTVDWIHLNEFYFHTPYDRSFGINSPLDSSDEDNVKSSLEYYLEEGVPSNKIVLGVASFGYGYTNLNQPGDVSGMVGYHQEWNGVLAFHEVCEKVNDRSEWSTTWDEKSSTPITSKKGGNQKISFDDQRSIELKVAYANEKKLLGVYLWSLDNDDFKGFCSLYTPSYDGHDKYKYPILRTINTVLKRNSNENNVLNVTVIVYKV